MAHTHNLIFLCAKNFASLHSELRVASAKVEAIKVELPNHDERMAYIEWATQQKQVQLEAGLSVEALARNTGGLRLIDLDDIVQRARVYHEGVVQLAEARTRKDAIIRQEYGGLITVMEAKHGFDAVGGFSFLKEQFRQKVLFRIEGGNLNRVPKGFVLSGPPGVGKTFLVSALAREANMTVVRLDIGRIFNMYVGQSEARLELVLAALWSMAPIILVIDEIDQHINRATSGEAGVSSRVFGRLLQFLSEPDLRGRIITFAMTNRPDLLDPALKRAGRLEVSIPFFPPDTEERTAVIEVLARKHHVEIDTELIEILVDGTGGWTQAEMDSLIRKVADMVDEGGMGKTAVATAFDLIFPATQQVEDYVRLALAEITDGEWLPPAMRQQLAQRRRGVVSEPETGLAMETLFRQERF